MLNKNRLHYLLQRTRATELSAAVLESIAQIDGSVVLDRESKLLAIGAILRHHFPVGEDANINEDGDRRPNARALQEAAFANKNPREFVARPVVAERFQTTIGRPQFAD